MRVVEEGIDRLIAFEIDNANELPLKNLVDEAVASLNGRAEGSVLGQTRAGSDHCLWHLEELLGLEEISLGEREPSTVFWTEVAADIVRPRSLDLLDRQLDRPLRVGLFRVHRMLAGVEDDQSIHLCAQFYSSTGGGVILNKAYAAVFAHLDLAEEVHVH